MTEAQHQELDALIEAWLLAPSQRDIDSRELRDALVKIAETYQPAPIGNL